MTPTQKGKHCAVCKKEVVDFTTMSNEQLYKKAIDGGKLCGRFIKNQLDRDLQLYRKQGRSWASYAASLLIPATILVTQQARAQSNITPVEQTDGSYISLGISSLLRPNQGDISQKQNKRDTLTKADTYSIKGTVSDKEGPIPGATILIKGTNIKTQTDFDGNYGLNVSEDDVLVISSIRYNDNEVRVGNHAMIHLVLEKKVIKYTPNRVMMGKFYIQKPENTPH